MAQVRISGYWQGCEWQPQQRSHGLVALELVLLLGTVGRVFLATIKCCLCAFHQGQYCDICSSANSNKAHPITNAIDGTERWWQSPPLSRGLEFNQVNVTLDLGQVSQVLLGCVGGCAGKDRPFWASAVL